MRRNRSNSIKLAHERVSFGVWILRDSTILVNSRHKYFFNSEFIEIEKIAVGTFISNYALSSGNPVLCHSWLIF